MKEGAYGYDSYLSPFTWRYGSEEMRKLFSETQRRATWRKVWLSLAEAEAGFGLISGKELDGIRRSAGEGSVDIARAHEIEKRIKHDLMAELMVFVDQAKEGEGSCTWEPRRWTSRTTPT